MEASPQAALAGELLLPLVRSMDYKGDMKAIQVLIGENVKSFTNSRQILRERVKPRDLAGF